MMEIQVKILELKRNKLKELSISMVLGILCLLIFLGVSVNPLSAYIFAHSVQGEVIEYNVTRERPAFFNASDRTPERHEVLVEYKVDGKKYWILANSHAYSALGLIKTGDKMMVTYTEEHPAHGYILSYLLYSPLAAILAPFILLILLIVTPQWIYHFRKAS
jgi:hypothetical protein